MNTATMIPHRVTLEPVTDLMRRRLPELPEDATVVAVRSNANGGFRKEHTDVTDGCGRDVNALAAALADEHGAVLIAANGRPADDVWPPKPKPGVCPNCSRVKPITEAVGSSGRGNLCLCKRVAGAR